MWKTSDASQQPLVVVVQLLLLLVMCSALHADFHKWVDETGQVHYGDCPPVDCVSQSIEIPTPPSQQEVDRAHQRLERQQEFIQHLRSSRQPTSPVKTPPTMELIPQELPCFDPIDNILKGPSREKFAPITPTILTKKQQRDLTRMFNKLDTHWRKSRANMTVCNDTHEHCVTDTKYKDEDARVEVDAMSSHTGLKMKLKWYDKTKDRGGRFNIILAVGDMLYFTTNPDFHNIEQVRNSVEILHPDKKSLMFLIKPRIRGVKATIPFPEIRYFLISDK